MCHSIGVGSVQFLLVTFTCRGAPRTGRSPAASAAMLSSSVYRTVSNNDAIDAGVGDVGWHHKHLRWRRPASTTENPSAYNASAVARPMPLPAP